MDSAIEVLGTLIGISAGLFILITIVVLMPGRAAAARSSPPAHPGVVWFGGPGHGRPGHGEHGVTDSGLVLLDHRPGWIGAPESDWPALAETSEPGRNGGASAGW
ncbi:hypothetical protein [Spongiactinospora sp. TRM90649]|uniref:hypothetical protein n=1 Tax=Spongiactinospora sp. TRM90649 TaxID=3031114 RepID=UPI0023F8E5D9|nr:hypothetical protein [Spongiactinospora sp. TRM90649]MDF5758740.1 hypothetical protein [Spongiactinospora sp. TRM90649]